MGNSDNSSLARFVKKRPAEVAQYSWLICLSKGQVAGTSAEGRDVGRMQWPMFADVQ